MVIDTIYKSATAVFHIVHRADLDSLSFTNAIQQPYGPTIVLPFYRCLKLLGTAHN